MIFDQPFLWPEPGHVFFDHARTRPDAYTWMSGPTMSEYAHTYWESAEVIIDLACDAPGLLNVHAIPAVFLFRHFVELSLKDLILTALPLNDEPATLDEGHKLGVLWKKLRALIESADLAGGDDELDVVEQMIQELETVDPGSTSFRYPVERADKSGRNKPSLTEEFEYFDMRVFRDQATRLANFFGGCGTQLEEYLDIKREMDREYRFD